MSFTWLDHLIFAAVPLGILTALFGAIRVQGPKIARSFIGRARETRAAAEIALMSSTSQEVCEMFNGQGFVRTMGRPVMAQIIIFPDLYDKAKSDPYRDRTCGIYTLQDAVEVRDSGPPGVMTYRGMLTPTNQQLAFLTSVIRLSQQKLHSSSQVGEQTVMAFPLGQARVRYRRGQRHWWKTSTSVPRVLRATEFATEYLL